MIQNNKWKILPLYAVFMMSLFLCGSSSGSDKKAESGDTISTNTLRVSVQDAVLMALENNRSLRVERFNPSITHTYEEQELAKFDVNINGSASFSREKAPAGRTGPTVSTASGADISLGMSKFFPTGTDLDLDFSVNRTWSDQLRNRYESRMGLSMTQALLRGAGSDVNLAAVRQARLDTIYSEYELRGFSQTLIAEVEENYWDYFLAGRNIEIYEESLKLAEQQLKETQEIIAVGKLAETELVAAQAEIALRRQELIDAENVVASKRLRFLRLLNPQGPGLWEKDILLLDKPIVPDIKRANIESHIRLAHRKRPEMNQARLDLEKKDIEIVKTKNGLLPKMDFFISLGKSGYSDSFGSSLEDINEKSYDMLLGIRTEFPFQNRASNAQHQRALLTQEKSREALENLLQLVELDVRTAYIELERAEQQINASIATRELEEEKVRIEIEKFRVGKSTSFMVAQAQRDLIRSRIAEISSVVSYLKALVNLHLMDGSLLERWGIEAPGRESFEELAPD